jgi:F420-0:gamma-glutamyl ligase-like protein
MIKCPLCGSRVTVDEVRVNEDISCIAFHCTNAECQIYLVKDEHVMAEMEKAWFKDVDERVQHRTITERRVEKMLNKGEYVPGAVVKMFHYTLWLRKLWGTVKPKIDRTNRIRDYRELGKAIVEEMEEAKQKMLDGLCEADRQHSEAN